MHFCVFLSLPHTNQQPLANKNVLSVTLNYKHWASLYCSLLIMLNGLPLTITKPLTYCLSMCMCMCTACQCVCGEEMGGGVNNFSMPAYLRKDALAFFMALKAPVACSEFTCLQSVCTSACDVSDRKRKGKDEGRESSDVKDNS